MSDRRGYSWRVNKSEGKNSGKTTHRPIVYLAADVAGGTGFATESPLAALCARPIDFGKSERCGRGQQGSTTPDVDVTGKARQPRSAVALFLPDEFWHSRLRSYQSVSLAVSSMYNNCAAIEKCLTRSPAIRQMKCGIGVLATNFVSRPPRRWQHLFKRS